ncbi:thiol-disulfide oxidoreductase DCC family protein [Bergeyella zoohelcum]|uniref:Protein of uncharacterized function, DUF393 n=1 Tax=Bergeyella zoohelcum TaxID=1015 RepID=A0A7Z8YQB4_9FLAO|nr:DCC1-like thiol-disulfide oxidoreductase family protein [Bergeyella zoohelcum]VDH06578.1 Protein of uncharacterised function, DUF393 [Bergeyella zoohelcum]
MKKYIIYDKKCEFCTKFSNWNKVQNSHLKTIPIRSKEAKSILRERGLQFIDLQTIYFVDDKEVFNRSKAVFNIFSNFKYPYKLFSVLKILPQSFTDYFYKIVAKYRYKIKI